MRAPIAWASLACAGCCLGSPAPAPTPGPAGRPLVAPAVAPPASPAPPAPTTSSIQAQHIANFRHDELDECVDFITTLPSGLDANRLPLMDIGVDAQRLTRPCEEQFAGRTVLATCAERHEVPTKRGTGTIVSTSRFYRYETTFDRQDFMRDCLHRGGDWQAVAEDSLELLQAKMHWLERRRR